LVILGLILQGGSAKPKDIRILGVLQRLALCYFLTAVLVLIFDDAEDELNSSPWPIGKNKLTFLNIYFIYLGDDVNQPIRDELSNTVFQFWPQWLCILFITVAWTLITFVPKLSNCPRGYVGPGGRHDHGRHQNCTGGKIDIIH
jgi:heparan-alpha-glucosaminide N-acetyltransferase